ncbi:MAG: hypothetical protein ACP5N3_01405 [Candidatus Nanoarchaeia archaeon]
MIKFDLTKEREVFLEHVDRLFCSDSNNIFSSLGELLEEFNKSDYVRIGDSEEELEYVLRNQGLIFNNIILSEGLGSDKATIINKPYTDNVVKAKGITLPFYYNARIYDVSETAEGLVLLKTIFDLNAGEKSKQTYERNQIMELLGFLGGNECKEYIVNTPSFKSRVGSDLVTPVSFSVILKKRNKETLYIHLDRTLKTSKGAGVYYEKNEEKRS